ncbi:MAG TPA: alkaline phosphatase family protein [Gammaproteobacteria bacterium]|jgi:predicted AlkP superfamily pyrophosphatase or phosphodiesterase|nr:alkaline phosphatase family protein [Gammaproteobacteria bacterium]
MSVKQTPPIVLINIVGLTRALLGEHTPHLNRLFNTPSAKPLQGVFPAVTTTAQTTMLTGELPEAHGIVSNGWYWRDQAEVKFWQQSNHLVTAPRLWHRVREQRPDFVLSNMFWWYNMYSDADHSVTPRPHYPADGRKIVGLYSNPPDLHARLEQALGPFPFFNFWGPTADIRSSRWIARAAALEFEWHRPDLQLVYLPHLDYNLQRLGPEDPAIAQDLRDIDTVAGELIDRVIELGANVMVVSEYGIYPVDQDVALNRILRQQGYVAVRESLGTELLDPGASSAFAVADHQVAHIYVKQPSDCGAVKELIESTPGVERVLDREDMRVQGLAHPRSGDLIAVAEPRRWFSYYYWLDDRKAPDFAPTVDIHRKPGYDPAELFIDPALRWPKLRVLRRLAQKKLGLRMLMDVIPIHASQVKGSHGRLSADDDEKPVLLSTLAEASRDIDGLADVHDFLLRYFTD